MVLTESNYLSPAFFQDFRCYADKCMDTCCRGFSIPLDKPSIDAFHEFANTYMPTAVNHLQIVENEIFITFSQGSCPFLRNNLCKIQSTGGEKFLPYICRMYPRTIVNYEHLLKNSLFLSCEAVATSVLNWEQIDAEFEYAAVLDKAVIKQNRFFQNVSADLIRMHKTLTVSAKMITEKMDITDDALLEIIKTSRSDSCGLSDSDLRNLIAYYVWHYYTGRNESWVKDICLYMTVLDGICTVGCQNTKEKATIIHKISKEIEHSDSNMKRIRGFYQKQKGAINVESETLPF